MKKGLKITIGAIAGCMLFATVCGCLYGFNSSVRNWVDNAVGKVIKNVPEEYKNVLVESKLELTADQIKAQGLQAKEKTDPSFKLKFALKNLPTDFNGDSTLVTKIVTGNKDDVYFLSGGNKYYDSITHGSDQEFVFNRKFFTKPNQSDKFLIKTYWASYPDIFLNTQVEFKSDFKVTPAEKMAIVDEAHLTEGLLEVNGVQVYSDREPVAYIAPAIKNKTDKITKDSLIGTKVISGDASKIHFEGTVDYVSNGPIALSKDRALLSIKHDKFTRTNQVENYVVRSYLIQDEDTYMDSNITFKSDFTGDSQDVDVSWSVSVPSVEADYSVDTWMADEDGSLEVSLNNEITNGTKAVYFRIHPLTENAPEINMTVGTKKFKNGVADLDPQALIKFTAEGFEEDYYEYKVEVISADLPDNVFSETITIFAYDESLVDNESQVQPNLAPRMMLPRSAVIVSNGNNRSTELTATLLPANATDQKIIWSTSNSKVSLSATNSQSGDPITISASAPFDGYVTVIAKADVDYNIYATCTVSYQNAA